MPSVYLCIASEFIHPGILNVINTARSYGDVVIGILSDKVVASYKRVPLLDAQTRAEIFSSIQGVSSVVEQRSMSYRENLLRLRPDYVIHGDDWQSGIQANIRKEVIEILAQWGGSY